MARLGATAAPMPLNEVLAALQRNVIDGTRSALDLCHARVPGRLQGGHRHPRHHAGAGGDGQQAVARPAAGAHYAVRANLLDDATPLCRTRRRSAARFPPRLARRPGGARRRARPRAGRDPRLRGPHRPAYRGVAGAGRRRHRPRGRAFVHIRRVFVGPASSSCTGRVALAADREPLQSHVLAKLVPLSVPARGRHAKPHLPGQAGRAPELHASGGLDEWTPAQLSPLWPGLTGAPNALRHTYAHVRDRGRRVACSALARFMGTSVEQIDRTSGNSPPTRPRGRGSRSTRFCGPCRNAADGESFGR